MKMKPDHYEVLLSRMKATRDQYPDATPEAYEAQGIGKDTRKRHRWDCYMRAIRDAQPQHRILYEYLTDATIDTALRKIQAELWPESNTEEKA